MSDWIGRIKSNENEGLRDIYRLYRSECVSWIQKDFGCSLDEALDVFQMSVVILYDNIVQEKLTTLTVHIKTYIMGIARNKALELIRAKKRTIGSEPLDMIVNYLSEDLTSDEEFDLIKAASISLDRLGDPCKTVLMLYYYEEKNMDEITQILSYKNADTTKNQKYKCLKRLQTIYFDHINKSMSS